MVDENKNLVQLNALIEAEKDFSKIETDIFYLGLQDVNPHLTNKDKEYHKAFPDTVITPGELKQIFGHGQYLTEIDKVVKNLAKRIISIKLGRDTENFSIFQHVNYYHDKGLFIKFNEDMRPILLDIVESRELGFGGFTQFKMKYIFNFQSVYATRLMELLLQYRGEALKKKSYIIEHIFSLEQLRKCLKIDDNKYKRMDNFKTKVLDNPIKEINNREIYHIEYAVIKTGRKVTGFHFFCNFENEIKNDNFTDTIEADERQIDEDLQAKDDKTMDKELLSKLILHGFSTDNISKMFDLCGSAAELKSRLEWGEECARKQAEKGNPVGNMAGYLFTAITENWFASHLEGQAAAQNKENEWKIRAKEIFTDYPPLENDTEFLDVNKDGFIGEINKVRIQTILSGIEEGAKKGELPNQTESLLKQFGYTVESFIDTYVK